MNISAVSSPCSRPSLLKQADARPILGGLCLTAISVKPQFAALFGLVLLCAGQWRTVLAAVPATLGHVGLSVFLFGIGLWKNFFEWTSVYHANLLTDFVRDLLRTTVTVYSAARMVGLPALAAQTLQLVFGLVLMARAIVGYRRRAADARSIAIVLLAAIVALPYANHYDPAIAMHADTVALFGEASQRNDRLLLFIPAVVLWLAAIFALAFGAVGWPVVPVAVAAVALWAALATPLDTRRSGDALRATAPQLSH
jgi:hypothetical protein